MSARENLPLEELCRRYLEAQLARDLAGRGMRVALLARRRDRLEALAGELGGPDRALPLVADVADFDQVAAAILTPPDIISQFGLAIPAILLYELSIYSVKLVERKRLEEAEAKAAQPAE